MNDAPPTSLLVADSLLVDGGLALAAGVHRSRFVDSVRAQAPDLGDAAGAFWDRAVRGVPATGSWFPRITLDTSGAFGVSLRSAPARTTSLRLHSARVDPRTTPLIKGPDLARLDALRQEAVRAGADEAVIVSPEGLVVEGGYSSIAWWRGDALCVVDDTLERLPGVTENSLVTIATAFGVTVLRELVEPDDLADHEVWSLGSLHGPRIATSWVGGPTVAEQPGRLRLWRARLDALRRSVHSH
ncbi:amino-transferase class IV [Frondihabitans sp. PhB188]|uniref:aminotransferase class IV n=1 Tax=Frondihabitans sp. PhB188 TaxID=2485200 RepID=UPI000F48BB48|nr:aminotransferase class IV [Frondihabitans sp. PhB188]ROQ41215.1 amino-transferase class IV [Frondihabitans sp. PhB188]